MPDVFVKDPDEVKDYARNWAPVLGDDTIATSTWTPEAGVTVDSDSHTDTVATMRLSGGTEGEEYGVTNTVVTAGGQTLEFTLHFLIEEQ
jgi:hypothetical protein